MINKAAISARVLIPAVSNPLQNYPHGTAKYLMVVGGAKLSLSASAFTKRRGWHPDYIAQ